MQNPVFEYFFQIGSGLSIGIVSVVIPTLLIYRIVVNRMNRKGASE